ncbi:three-helix bundle dimerization domain-containing protein [Dactylosporangium sp. NPDC005555]|uniref:three-helix bundle dimerization domain-containing protein n=1 Tax=Dactylosporangium sp. NPDC005555 TaxID=3154889 RepID=UPI0033B14F6E
MFAAEAKTKVERHAIEHATERLIRRYAGRHDPEVVRQTVNQVTDLYATAEVYAFVPVLVERDARRILDEAAE